MATRKKTAKRKNRRQPVQVTVAKTGAKGRKVDVEVKTGLTAGKKYFVKVTPKTGRPVLIAVHL